MRRVLLSVLLVAGLAACRGHDHPIMGTTTLPPGATIIVRPAKSPPYPSHTAGFVRGRYVMAGDLTASGPRTAGPYALGTPAQRRALDLATALGFGDEPFNFGGNPWNIQRLGAVLEIWPDSGGRWRYTAPPEPPGQQPASPDEPQALKLARPILRAAGLDPADARAQRVNHTEVTVEPRIQKHPTWGWETKLQFEGKGLFYGSGWLGPAHAEPEHRLLDSVQAFTQLQREAAQRPAGNKHCPVTYQARTPPCQILNPYPMTTKARFAYAVDWKAEGYRPRLIPAWLFTRQGTEAPVAFPA